MGINLMNVLDICNILLRSEVVELWVHLAPWLEMKEVPGRIAFEYMNTHETAFT